MWSETDKIILTAALNYVTNKNIYYLSSEITEYKAKVLNFANQNYLDFLSNIELLSESSIIFLLRSKKDFIIKTLKNEGNKNVDQG